MKRIHLEKYLLILLFISITNVSCLKIESIVEGVEKPSKEECQERSNANNKNVSSTSDEPCPQGMVCQLSSSSEKSSKDDLIDRLCAEYKE